MDKDFERRKKVIDDLIHDKFYRPMKAKEIAILLNISKDERNALQEVLDALVTEGRIGLSKRGKYGRAENTALTGVFSSTQKGFGFVTVEGEAEDIFIPAGETADALHGDTVSVIVVRESSDGKRREGKILSVLQRGLVEVVGTYEDNGNYGFVIPDEKKLLSDIFVAGKDSMGAVNGHKVLVHLESYGDEKHNPEGRVTKILGHINDPGTDILSVVAAAGIPMEYPGEVMEEVQKLPDRIDPADLTGRKDLRELLTVTIDGEESKDLDDAVSLSVENGIYHLGVHIADVSQYVKEGSALDAEALNRGTSVYLVDRVIPMLPHKLSNGLCSLNEGEDRLALSCLMDIDIEGNVIGHEICESVIRSDHRMTYTSVAKILEAKDPAESETYASLVPMLKDMDCLAKLLREKRHRRGAIDFDFPESRVLVDEKGHPYEICQHERNAATMLIEDFMLAANETVAEEYYWQELPFVYRTHEKPDPDKIRSLGIFIHNFGYSLHVADREIHPMELQKLLTRIEGSDAEAMINRLTLRAMNRARYSEDCTGHFGLAAKYYCHFTSPIRRYPDLQIHRIIKENLHGGLDEKRISHYSNILPKVCEHTSKTERRADDAERDVEKMKKAEYMEKHIGENCSGVISGVTGWGLYVELPNTVEGMIPIGELMGDYYSYDEEHYEVVGERTHRSYRLGQRVTVECTGADKQLGQINFRLTEEEG